MIDDRKMIYECPVCGNRIKADHGEKITCSQDHVAMREVSKAVVNK